MLGGDLGTFGYGRAPAPWSVDGKTNVALRLLQKACRRLEGYSVPKVMLESILRALKGYYLDSEVTVTIAGELFALQAMALSPLGEPGCHCTLLSLPRSLPSRGGFPHSLCAGLRLAQCRDATKPRSNAFPPLATGSPCANSSASKSSSSSGNRPATMSALTASGSSPRNRSGGWPIPP